MTCGAQASVTRAMRIRSGGLRHALAGRGALALPASALRRAISSGQWRISIDPVEVLDQRGAAFDPVAVVVVLDAVERRGYSAVWMWPQTTPSTLRAAAARATSFLVACR